MTLHVHRFGRGETRHYFGIHGWGGGWHTFEPLAAHLPDDATLWAVDLPGYGDSEPLSDWEWTELADLIVTTVNGVEADELSLVGNCSGAAFGIGAQLRSPGLFSELFLIDPFAYFPWYFKLLVAKGVGPLFYSTAFANPIGRWVTNRSVSDRTGGVHATHSFEELDHDVVYAHLRMLQQLPELEAFGVIDVPTTVLYGERTFEAVRDSVGMWTDLWPHASAVELAGAGHLPIQETAAALSESIFCQI